VDLTRRDVLAFMSAAAAQACCTSIPDPKCWTTASPGCDAPQPLPVAGLEPRRCELFAFDEVHRATPTVYFPRSDDDLVKLFRATAGPRRVTIRGGGQSMDGQALNKDLVFSLGESFCDIGDPVLDESGYHITTGAGAQWGKVVKKIAALGLMPPSLVTAPLATVGGTMSSDCLSRMSAIVGKEGNQIRSFTIVTPNARAPVVCTRDDPDKDRRALFNAVIGGFGYLGVVTRVTFDLVVARSRPMVSWDNPCVLTRSSRHGPGVNWDAVLRDLQSRSVALRQLYVSNPRRYLGTRTSAKVPDVLARTPEWSALSIASFLTGSGMAANVLEQRYVDPQRLRPFPSGIYQATNSFPPAAELTSVTLPTLVELGLDMFPEGDFVDELIGWAFFLGNSTTIAKDSAHSAGNRLNFTQQSFALPAGPELATDTRPMRRFLEILEARLHAADIRPEAIDFLYIPADEYLMSASRGLTSFVITVSFAEMNRTAFSRSLTELLRALSGDCRTLGGRVHLVKGVNADADDLRAMYGDAAGDFLKLKAVHDPKNVLRNDFFDRIFLA
jgi:hypothetical protein